MINDVAFLLGTSLMYGTPLLYAALGGLISENSGIINIGLEGIMSLGAFIAAWLAYATGSPFIAFVGAGAAGLLLAMLHAVSSISFKANQVISGTALNFIGPGIAVFLSRLFFDGAAQTKNLNLAQKMPKPLLGVLPEDSFYGIVLNQDSAVYLAIIMVIIVWFMLYKTKLGLRIRACGEHPRAASSLGINVNRIRYGCVAASGLLAGFGGATLAIAVANSFFPALVSGHGFIALAAMIFGRRKPQGALGACLVFGFSNALAVLLGNKQIEISASLLSMLPYVMTLVVLVIMSRSRKPSGAVANGKLIDPEGN